MSKEKFTQGDWKIEPESDGNIWIISDKSVEAIANVCCGFNDATKKYEPEEKEMANAKIIAVAPKMINLLKYLNNCGGLGLDKHKFIEDVLNEAGVL